MSINRIRKRYPRKKGGWCPRCDMAIVHDGQKCPACGRKIKPYRNKRELNTMGNTVD